MPRAAARRAAAAAPIVSACSPQAITTPSPVDGDDPAGLGRRPRRGPAPARSGTIQGRNSRSGVSVAGRAPSAPGAGSKARIRAGDRDRRSGRQSIARFGLVDLARVGDAGLELRRECNPSVPASSRGIECRRQSLRRPASPAGRASCRRCRRPRSASSRRMADGPGIEAGLHPHDADAGLGYRRPRWRARSARRRASAAAARRGCSGSPTRRQVQDGLPAGSGRRRQPRGHRAAARQASAWIGPVAKGRRLQHRQPMLDSQTLDRPRPRSSARGRRADRAGSAPPDLEPRSAWRRSDRGRQQPGEGRSRECRRPGEDDRRQRSRRRQPPGRIGSGRGRDPLG